MLLDPILATGKPFKVYCVGPLPRIKSDNQFLLTILYAATLFPAAVLLENITAKSALHTLTKFFSTLGMPKSVQTDLGTNFQNSKSQNCLNKFPVVSTLDVCPKRERVISAWVVIWSLQPFLLLQWGLAQRLPWIWWEKCCSSLRFLLLTVATWWWNLGG